MIINDKTIEYQPLYQIITRRKQNVALKTKLQTWYKVAGKDYWMETMASHCFSKFWWP